MQPKDFRNLNCIHSEVMLTMMMGITPAAHHPFNKRSPLLTNGSANLICHSTMLDQLDNNQRAYFPPCQISFCAQLPYNYCMCSNQKPRNQFHGVLKYLSNAYRNKTKNGGFHLHLSVFPFVYQFNSRTGVLVHSSFANDYLRSISTTFEHHFKICLLWFLLTY